MSIAVLALGLAFAAAVATWCGTGAVRRYAFRKSMIDLPSIRSSHTQPTPRGGGLAIVIVVLSSVGLLMIVKPETAEIAAGVLGAGFLIAVVGWIDDHGHVPAPLRLVVHLVAAGWAVWWVGVPEPVTLGTWAIRLGAVGNALAILSLVWLTNLFNFMDGIDGIAGVEAVTVGAVGALLLFMGGASALALVALVIASAAAGFLLWNRPPAKIFMGDVGSGFLGMVIGILVLAGAEQGAVSVWVWALLLGVFLFDATVTLFRRVGKEPLHHAHNQHAYQRAVQGGRTHGQVIKVVAAFNGLLSILACLAWALPYLDFVLLAAAFVILTTAYLAVERLQPMHSRSAQKGVLTHRMLTDVNEPPESLGKEDE